MSLRTCYGRCQGSERLSLAQSHTACESSWDDPRSHTVIVQLREGMRGGDGAERQRGRRGDPSLSWWASHLVVKAPRSPDALQHPLILLPHAPAPPRSPTPHLKPRSPHIPRPSPSFPAPSLQPHVLEPRSRHIAPPKSKALAPLDQTEVGRRQAAAQWPLPWGHSATWWADSRSPAEGAARPCPRRVGVRSPRRGRGAVRSPADGNTEYRNRLRGAPSLGARSPSLSRSWGSGPPWQAGLPRLVVRTS